MDDVCVIGASKTGTTGVYSSVRSAFERDGVRFYGMHEKYPPEMYQSLGLYQPDRTILSKMLLTNKHFSARTTSWFDKRVLISRDPRDTLVSVLLYYPVLAVNQGVSHEQVDAFVDLIREKENDPSSHSFVDLLRAVYRLKGTEVGPNARFARRFDLVVRFADEHDSFLLGYEDFVDDRLDSLSDYLGRAVHNSKPDDTTGIVFRSGTHGDWRSWFLPEDVEHFRPALLPYMQRFGYADEWELSPDPQLDPSQASGYVVHSTTKRQSQIDHASGTRSSISEQLAELRGRADGGSATAAFRCATLLEDHADLVLGPTEVHDLALFAASCGHAQAMALVADLYCDGRWVDVDEDQARFWEREHALTAESDAARKRALNQARRAGKRGDKIHIDEDILASTRYQVGSAVVDAVKKPGRHTLRLPGVLYRVARGESDLPAGG